MKNPRYKVQVFGSNSYAKPHWMNVSYRASLKAAVTAKEKLIAQGIKPEEIRIVKI